MPCAPPPPGQEVAIATLKLATLGRYRAASSQFGVGRSPVAPAVVAAWGAVPRPFAPCPDVKNPPFPRAGSPGRAGDAAAPGVLGQRLASAGAAVGTRAAGARTPRCRRGRT